MTSLKLPCRALELLVWAVVEPCTVLNYCSLHAANRNVVFGVLFANGLSLGGIPLHWAWGHDARRRYRTISLSSIFGAWELGSLVGWRLAGSWGNLKARRSSQRAVPVVDLCIEPSN